MDIEALRSFQRVARRRSFTQAAAELHVAQPALSKRIAHLEREVGSLLFQRLGRRIELTPAGRIFLEYVERTLDEIGRAQEAIGQLARMGRGEVRLGTVASVADHLLPPVLCDFLRAYPQIDVLVNTAGLDAVTDSVLAGEFDAAIVPLPAVHHRLKEEVLLEEEFVLAVPAGHPWAARRTVTFGELAGVELTVPPIGSWARDYFGPACRQTGVRFSVRAEVRSYKAIRTLVAAGVGVGLVPELVLPDDEGGIRRVRIVEPRVVREIAWVYPRGRILPRPLEELRVRLNRHVARYTRSPAVPPKPE